MSLEKALADDLQAAMRGGDGVKRDTIRQLRAALHNEAISLGHALTDQESQTVVRRSVNQHKDSISEFGKAGRTELVAKEEAELAILVTYLAPEMSRDEIVTIVRDVAAAIGISEKKDAGKVMRELSAQLKGKADMRLVNEVVQELLV